MKKDELYSTVLGCSVSGFYKWKKSDRLIISLLQEYFSDDDLEEFLADGKIQKQELIKDIDFHELKQLIENKDLLSKLVEIKEVLK